MISIGRSEDPTDALGRVRRNRVAFLDVVDGVTETVGRAHARLRFDAGANELPPLRRGQQQRHVDHRGGATIAVRRATRVAYASCPATRSRSAARCSRIVIGA